MLPEVALQCWEDEEFEKLKQEVVFAASAVAAMKLFDYAFQEKAKKCEEEKKKKDRKKTADFAFEAVHPSW